MTTDRMRIVELERGQPVRDVLSTLLDQGYDLEQIGRELGVSSQTVRRWLKHHKAVRRLVYEIPALADS